MSSKVFNSLNQVMFLLLVGCDFLSSKNLDPNSAKKVTLNVSELGCLNSVNENIFQYLEDKLPATAIEETFDCIDSTVKKFTTLTKPTVLDKYSSKELQHFLNRYLLEDKKISNKFMIEIMKVKAFVLGGDVHYLSKEEIKRGRDYLGKVKREAFSLLGSIKVITFQQPIRDEAQLDSIPKKVKQTIQNLTADTAFSGDYGIEDSISFFIELSEFAGHNGFCEHLQKYSPLIINLKNLLIGLGNNTQGKSQWLRSVEWTSNVFSLSLKANWLYKNFNSESSRIWIELVNLGDQALNLLEQSPQFIHHRRWHTHHLDQVIAEMVKLNLINSTLPKDVWIKSYKMAVIRFLSFDRNAERGPFELTSLDESHLKVFREEWTIWKSNQNWILKFDTFSRSELKQRAQNDLQSKIRLVGHQDWLKLFIDDKFYTLNSAQKITFGRSNSPHGQSSLSGISLQNTIYILSRFMIRSYGDGEGASSSLKTLKAPGLAQSESDFFDLLTGLRVIDPRVLDRPKRFIEEANLFTLSGNGDSEIDVVELSELITLMLTAGKFMTDRFFSELILRKNFEKCPASGYDLLGKPKFLKGCITDSFYTFFPNILSLIEGLRIEWSGLDQGEERALINMLLEFGKVGDPTNLDMMEYVEYRTSIVFLFYLESIFTRYDRNRDWLLGYEEILDSYPRFKNFIRQKVYVRFKGRFPQSISSFAKDWDALTEEIFLYVVYHGREPSLLELMAFQYRKIRGLPSITRVHLLNVFDYLKDSERTY